MPPKSRKKVFRKCLATPKKVKKVSLETFFRLLIDFSDTFGTEKAFKGGARFARAPFGGFLSRESVRKVWKKSKKNLRGHFFDTFSTFLGVAGHFLETFLTLFGGIGK